MTRPIDRKIHHNLGRSLPVRRIAFVAVEKRHHRTLPRHPCLLRAGADPLHRRHGLRAFLRTLNARRSHRNRRLLGIDRLLRRHCDFRVVVLYRLVGCIGRYHAIGIVGFGRCALGNVLFL